MPSIVTNFKFKSSSPNFERDQVKKINDLKIAGMNDYDIGHIVYCMENNKHYAFGINRSSINSTLIYDNITGYFSELKTGVGDGGSSSGSGDGVRVQIAYKRSKLDHTAEPEQIAELLLPEGWSWDAKNDVITHKDLSDIDVNGWAIDDSKLERNDENGNPLQLWQSVGVFYLSEPSVGHWGTPYCLSARPGEDGDTIEFIYARTKDETTKPYLPTGYENDKEYQNNDFFPTYSSGDVPEGMVTGADSEGNPRYWFDNPQGISLENQCEWFCQRFRKDGVWGLFSEPVLWAKWGVVGRDGDGVEYIYNKRGKNDVPPLPEFCSDEDFDTGITVQVKPLGIENGTYGEVNYQEDEYVPNGDFKYIKPNGEEEFETITGWLDEPGGVSIDEPWEFVSIRKFNRKTGTWGKFSKPVLWAHYSRQGFRSYVFTKFKSKPKTPVDNAKTFQVEYEDKNITKTITIGQTTTSHPIPVDPDIDPENPRWKSPDQHAIWYDGIPDNDNPFDDSGASNGKITAPLYMSWKDFFIGEKGEESTGWSEPAIMKDSNDMLVEYNNSDTFPEDPTGNYNEVGIDEHGWYDPYDPNSISKNDWDEEYRRDFVDNAIWMAMRKLNNGTPIGEWTVVKIKGEDGEDGTSINIKGTYDTYEALETARINTISVNDTMIDPAEAGGFKSYDDTKCKEYTDQTTKESIKQYNPKMGDTYLIKNVNVMAKDGTWRAIDTNEIHYENSKGIASYDPHTILKDGIEDFNKDKAEAEHITLFTNGAFTWDGDSWVFVGRIAGESNYVHIKYSANPGVMKIETDPEVKETINLSMQDAPTDDNMICKYMGICVHEDINPPVNVKDSEGNVTKYAYEFYKWSKFAGEDGFGYEYIYMRSRGNNPENPALPNLDEKPDGYQNPEYVPGDDEKAKYDKGTVDDGKGNEGTKYTWWTDEQQGVSEEYPYEWMTWRKYSKENGEWGDWKGNSKGTAFLQNVWNGMEFTSFVFTRLKYDIDLTNATVTGGTFSNPIPTETKYGDNTVMDHVNNKDDESWQWHDSVPTNGAGNIWMTQARFNIGMDGKGDSKPTWTKPVIMNDTTEQDVDWCPNDVSDPGTPDNPATGVQWFENVYTDTDAEGGAGQTWPEANGQKLPAIWMAVRPLKNGVAAGEWVITRIHGEKGDKGDPGTSINIKGRYNTTHDMYFAWMGLDCMTEIDEQTGNSDGTLSTNNPPKESDSYIISDNITSYDDEDWEQDANGKYIKVTGPITVDGTGKLIMGDIIPSPSNTNDPNKAHSIYVSVNDFKSSVNKMYPNATNLAKFITDNSYSPKESVIEPNYGHIYVYVPGAFDLSMVEIVDGYCKYNVWEDCGKFTGNDGLTAHTHIKYSDNPDVMDSGIIDVDKLEAIKNSLNESPIKTDGDNTIVMKYMGIYSDNKDTDETDYKLYKWSKFVGEDGFGYEYIYKLDASENPIKAPKENEKNKDGFLPKVDGAEGDEKWSDGRLQVTSGLPYEHMFWRRKETNSNGVYEWSDWKGQIINSEVKSIISNRYATATHTPMCSLSVSPKTIKLVGGQYSDDLKVQIIKKTGDDYETLTPGEVDGITVKYRIDGGKEGEDDPELIGNTLKLSEVQAKNNVVINLEDLSNDIIDTETIFVLQDNNAYIADFTDDSYSIACSAGGKPINSGELDDFSTTFNVYKGINKSEITNFIVKERYVEGNYYPGFTIKAVKSDQTVEKTIIVPKHDYDGTDINFNVDGTSKKMTVDEFQTKYLTLSGINSDDIVLSTFTEFDESAALVLDYVCTGTTDNTDRSATFSIKKVQPGGTAPSKYVIVPNTYGIDLVDNTSKPDSFSINKIVRYYFDENGVAEKSEEYETLLKLANHFKSSGYLNVVVYYEDGSRATNELNFGVQDGGLSRSLSAASFINTFIKPNGARATHIICELSDGSQNVADMYIPITRNGVPGTAGSMYILNPTADVIKAKTSIVNGTKTTTFSPSTINVYLNHIVGNAITPVNKFTLGLSVDGNSPSSIQAPSSFVTLTLSDILTNTTTEYSYLNLSYSYTGDDNNSVNITKTIPILYDGEVGEITDIYSLQCSSDVIKVDKDGDYTPKNMTPLALLRQGSKVSVLQTSLKDKTVDGKEVIDNPGYQIWIILKKAAGEYYALSNYQSPTGSDTYYVALSNEIDSSTYLKYNINKLVNNLELVENTEGTTKRDVPGFFGRADGIPYGINMPDKGEYAVATGIDPSNNNNPTIDSDPEIKTIQDSQSLEVYLIGELNTKTPKILDHESIPILKDGEDNYTVNLSNDLIAISCDADGTPKSTDAYTSTVSVYKGINHHTNITLDDITVTADGYYSLNTVKKPINGMYLSITNGLTINVQPMHVDTVITANTYIEVAFTIPGSSTTITKTLKVIAVKDGQQGAGKSGKIPYYAGEYNGGTYIQTPTATPYVFYNDGSDVTKHGYYLLISDSSEGNVPTNPAYWLKMEQFEAIYSNVGVIKQALVGKAVFDKDWMYSQDCVKYKWNKDTSACVQCRYNFNKDGSGNLGPYYSSVGPVGETRHGQFILNIPFYYLGNSHAESDGYHMSLPDVLTSGNPTNLQLVQYNSEKSVFNHEFYAIPGQAYYTAGCFYQKTEIPATATSLADSNNASKYVALTLKNSTNVAFAECGCISVMNPSYSNEGVSLSTVTVNGYTYTSDGFIYDCNDSPAYVWDQRKNSDGNSVYDAWINNNTNEGYIGIRVRTDGRPDSHTDTGISVPYCSCTDTSPKNRKFSTNKSYTQILFDTQYVSFFQWYLSISGMGSAYANYNHKEPGHFVHDDVCPKWGVNLVTGASWSAGGLTKNNADGSGWTAGGKYLWDSNGNTFVSPIGNLSIVNNGDANNPSYMYNIVVDNVNTYNTYLNSNMLLLAGLKNNGYLHSINGDCIYVNRFCDGLISNNKINISGYLDQNLVSEDVKSVVLLYNNVILDKVDTSSLFAKKTSRIQVDISWANNGSGDYETDKVYFDIDNQFQNNNSSSGIKYNAAFSMELPGLPTAAVEGGPALPVTIKSRGGAGSTGISLVIYAPTEFNDENIIINVPISLWCNGIKTFNNTLQPEGETPPIKLYATDNDTVVPTSKYGDPISDTGNSFTYMASHMQGNIEITEKIADNKYIQKYVYIYQGK